MFFSAFLRFGKLGGLLRQNTGSAPSAGTLYMDDDVTVLTEDDGATALLEG